MKLMLPVRSQVTKPFVSDSSPVSFASIHDSKRVTISLKVELKYYTIHPIPALSLELTTVCCKEGSLNLLNAFLTLKNI
jgi:hypothetical protein